MTSSGIRHVDLRVGVLMHRWPWIGSLADAIGAFRSALPGPDTLTVSFLGAVNLSKPHDVLDAVFGQVLEDAMAGGLLAGLDINMRPADLPALDRVPGRAARPPARRPAHQHPPGRAVRRRVLPAGPVPHHPQPDRPRRPAAGGRGDGPADPGARHLPGHVPREQHQAGRVGLDPLQSRRQGDAPGAARHRQLRRPAPVRRGPGRQPGPGRAVPRPARAARLAGTRYGYRR